MQSKSFVLLSGGIDSTTCLYRAYRNTPKGNVMGISINYGQRHTKEIEYAKKNCDLLGIEHMIIPLGDILSGKQVMLTEESRGNVEIPNISYDQIKGVSPTYVPFRNGTMLAVVTAQAQKYAMEQINNLAAVNTDLHGISEDQAKEEATREARDLCAVYFGAHAEDAANWAYPDCTPEFIGAMSNAIYAGTYNTVRLITPYAYDTKAEIIMNGVELNVPYEHTWSCYKGGEVHCGVCPTCIARKQAFIDADCVDPTEYAA